MNKKAVYKLLTIGQAAEVLGVTTTTLRNWDKQGILVPDERTIGGDRRYRLEQLTGRSINGKFIKKDNLKTIAYARVSTNEQKADLERQMSILEMHCAEKGYDYEIIKDIGSGMNYYKRGLKKLLNALIRGEIGRLIITHKDRLLRFGAELVFSLCEAKGCEVVILNKGQDTTFEEDLAKDVLEIITVFSARLYGARSNKNKKLLENVQKAANDSLS